MVITPGYDFSASEIPTRSKLALMVSGMSLTGIDLSQIATNLIGEKLGETAASLPSEGWLRADAQNALWVKTEWGEVKIFRANWGGWETRRFRVAGGLDTFVGNSKPQGARGTFAMSPLADTSPSNVIWQPESGSGAQTANQALLESTDSGSYGRLVMRGGTIGPVNRTQRTGYPDYIQTFQTGGWSNWAVSVFPITNVSFHNISGLMARAPASNRSLLWLYGATLGVQ